MWSSAVVHWEMLFQTTSGYLNYFCLPVSPNSPLSSGNNRAFVPRQLPLTGYFLYYLCKPYGWLCGKISEAQQFLKQFMTFLSNSEFQNQSHLNPLCSPILMLCLILTIYMQLVSAKLLSTWTLTTVYKWCKCYAFNCMLFTRNAVSSTHSEAFCLVIIYSHNIR